MHAAATTLVSWLVPPAPRERAVRLSDDDGHSWTFGPGDAFLVPSGFSGTWETLEPARKFYAIYEPPPA